MKIIKNILYFVIAFIITLFILELFVHFSFIETQSPTDFTEQYGRCRRKNMDYIYFNEGFSMGNFNKGRYLNSYYPIEKPKGVIRIAALGDSYVEGFQVFERNHFLKIVEKKLNEVTPDSVQILNFGRSGFDFGDMYAYYDRIVKQYNCDFVLFFLSNLDLNINQTDPLIPKVINTNGKLKVTNDEMPEKYKNTFKYQLLFSHNSNIYNMINDTRKLIKARELAPKLFDKFYFGKRIDAQKEDLGYRTKEHISKLSYSILEQLEKEQSTFIILNRDKVNLNEDFVKKIKAPTMYFNLSLESNLYKHNNDPHHWIITGKEGHWNVNGHIIVGNSLSEYLYKIITK